MKTTPETDAEESHGFDEFGGEQTLVSADFARKLERERDEWKAAHDNQVKLRRMLMDRPDLKDRAELVSQLAEKNELIERRRNKGLETIAALAEERDDAVSAYKAIQELDRDLCAERDQLRKVADEVFDETNSMINYCNGDIMYGVTDIRFLKARCLENLKRINSLPHVKERNAK